MPSIMKLFIFPIFFFVLSNFIFIELSFADSKSPFDMSLEELGNIEITSLTKNKSKVEDSAAAVFVISQSDIRRSSATSIPELLRIVPGLQVAKINSNSWAITSRGFNNGFSNKLLVLIDGRAVYDPIFSGVNWDSIDLVFEDIERIEVIRGPGATVWGANAVNGVINIITKSAGDTSGSHISVGSGSEDHLILAARSGAKVTENIDARVFAKVIDRDGSRLLNKDDAYDSWRTANTGFRLDSKPSDRDTLRLSGDFYIGRENGDTDIPNIIPPYVTKEKVNGQISNKNVLARWEHAYGEDSNLFVQGFYAEIDRDIVLADGDSRTYDLEIQNSGKISEHHFLTTGIGYRLVNAEVTSANIPSLPPSEFDPSSRSYDISNLYVQDEITLIPDRLTATVGTKFEYRNYTGLQVQPGVRLAYKPDEKQVFWGSVAKAVRTPSQVERDVNFSYQAMPGDNGLANLLSFQGNKGVDSENLVAYELGYRVSPSKTVSIDIASYINHYSNLVGVVPGTPSLQSGALGPYVSVPLVFNNLENGNVFGTEAGVTWDVFDWWRLSGWYTYMEFDALRTEASTNPNNQFLLRSLITIADRYEIDPIFRYVGELRELGVRDYAEADLRLGYRLCERVVLSLMGRNLLNSAHVEFIPDELRRPITQNERSVFFKVDANF